MNSLEVAADKMAIMDVVYKYCRAIDRLDRELLESVFHEDSIHHHGEYKGPSAQFCDFAFDILEKYYGKKKFNDGRKKMAMMPRGSSLIYNQSSAAPGLMIKNVFCLPGVPSILMSMIENSKKYLIKGSKTSSQTISCITVESNIAKDLKKAQKKFKKDLTIGSYPFFRLGKVGVSIVIRSKNIKKLKICLSLIKKILKQKKIKTFNLDRKAN